MANPAAVYCEGLGNATENVIRNGGQDEDCIFRDGSRCAAWDLLAGRCGREFTFCERQGNTIEEGPGIGTCRFVDGSSCDGYLYFSRECSPGDNPGQLKVEPTSEVRSPETLSFSDARDLVAAYLFTKYGIAQAEVWIEQDITPGNAVGSSTFRYISGPLTIVLTAEASAPAPSVYTVDEASFVANGFYWRGSVAADGQVVETSVIPASSILDEAQARDAILARMTRSYNALAPGTWTDAGMSQADGDLVVRVFESGSWKVEVSFVPASPLVSEYPVTVEDLSEATRWEGKITSRGEARETSFIQ